MSDSSWPPLDELGRMSPAEREANRDAALRLIKGKLNDIHEFTKDEVEILKFVIDFFRGARIVAKGGRIVFVAATLIAGAVSAWDKVSGGVKSWFHG